MSLLSETELKRAERKYSEGITSAAVVKIFKSKGERFSEATLRKYVQLGLLPTSKRVGIRGKHRGSSGLYPSIVVRLANEIKRGLENGSSLDDIRFGTIGLTGELELVRHAVHQALERLEEAVQKRSPQAQKSGLKQRLVQRRRAMEREIKGLEQFISRLGGAT